MKKKRLLLTALALVLAVGLVSAFWVMSLLKPGLSAYNGKRPVEAENYSYAGESGTDDLQNVDSDRKGSITYTTADMMGKSGNDEASEMPETDGGDNNAAIEEGADGGTGEPADKPVDGGMDGRSDDEITEDEEEEDITEKVSIIFNEDPTVSQDMDQNGNIKVIVKPSETIKIDPELAEKLEKDAREAKQPLTGLFRTSMAVIQTEGELKFNFSIENISGEDQEYYSGSSQRYDFYVYDSEGREVYRWSNDMCFAAVITETLLKKGENRSFNEMWDYTGSEGSRITPGEYLLVVKIIARMDNGRVIDADELTAREYITVV